MTKIIPRDHCLLNVIWTVGIIFLFIKKRFKFEYCQDPLNKLWTFLMSLGWKNWRLLSLIDAVSCSPLIRIIGDRFPWQVKEAILSTLSIIISKGGIALKPFLPQLQTTFIKCLQDNARFSHLFIGSQSPFQFFFLPVVLIFSMQVGSIKFSPCSCKA